MVAKTLIGRNESALAFSVLNYPKTFTQNPLLAQSLCREWVVARFFVCAIVFLHKKCITNKP